jgi:hypothetical protein
MEFQIQYITGHERAKATGPVNLDALGEVIDGYVPGWNPDPDAEDVTKLNASLAERDALIKRMEAQLRFQHEVLAEIHELTGAESKHPLTDRDLIRVKAQVALRQAAKSGLLT